MVASACAASAAVRTASAEKPPCARPFFSKATSSVLSSTRRTLIGVVLLSPGYLPNNPSTACLLTTPADSYICRGDIFRRTFGPRRPSPTAAAPGAGAVRWARAHDPGFPARGVGLHRDVARLSAEALRCDARGRHRL